MCFFQDFRADFNILWKVSSKIKKKVSLMLMQNYVNNSTTPHFELWLNKESKLPTSVVHIFNTFTIHVLYKTYIGKLLQWKNPNNIRITKKI